MNKTDDLVTKKFVEDTVEGAVEDIREVIEKNQNIVLDRLDSIMGSIRKNDYSSLINPLSE